MADSHLVSVIIPVYNGERYLAEAIQSVLDQTLLPDEIIVVDDGSIDATAQIVHDLAETAPVPISYIYQTNQGPAAARNAGIQLGCGDILAFLDADDVWHPAKLAVQWELLFGRPDAQVVWGYIQLFSTVDGMQRTWGYPWHGPHLGSALFRRTAFDLVGTFDEKICYCEDLDWLLQARELGLPQIIHPEVVLWYRRHPSNMSLARPAHLDTLITIKRLLDRRRIGT